MLQYKEQHSPAGSTHWLD